MITVSILINGNAIYTRSAVNVTDENVRIKADTKCTYEVDTGVKIVHRYGDGAVVLAKLMLDTIKETR